ncbi:sensor domain-containing diguanylate cyclase [Paraburkholderia sp. Ac-20347]|uniref:sensor domain-containing diguanylate cyclase n=1 Tax=Paraburkholderia sp. Ac-20347 TaxID=2703892 RepID=UPI0019806754|nr:sensor domain-containing diguanylate cyclase [Paraburkholderia sp. Ac-20347]MBN3810329.1 diguanylate cyclase [Paraburkholderia sp. Ac-20347]
MIKLGLTARLSILLVCIGVLASGATGYSTYQANRRLLMREAERSLLTSTQLLGQRFTAALGDVAADALVLATLPSSVQVALGDASGPGSTRLKQVFVGFMLQHPEYRQIRLISRSHFGLERVRVARGEHGVMVVPDDDLQEKGQFPYVFDTLIADTGRVYLSQIGLEGGVASDPDQPVVRIGTPVADTSGNNIGVLVIDVDLTRVFERIERDLPSDYAVYMANEWGDFLVHPDPSQTFGFARGRRVLMQKTFPLTTALFDGSQSTVTFNGFAHAHEPPAEVFAFARLPYGVVDDKRFVTLGLARPLSDVLEPANALGAQIVWLALISSVIAIVLAMLFARALVRPLRTLAHAVTHIFDDAAIQRLPVARSDEIGVLARCFERMRSEIRSQVHELRARQEELTHLAGHDPLTGLPNRMRFMDQLEFAIGRAAPGGEKLAVLFVDLNGFKQINDHFGHSAGDAALVVVAQRLRAALRETDIVARFGGDEFVILAGDVQSPDAIDSTAARIQAAMHLAVPVGAHSVNVGVSIGVSEFPADGDHAGELLAKADAAMYIAKTLPGADCVRYRERMNVSGDTADQSRALRDIE